jgi:hypothetical protein
LELLPYAREGIDVQLKGFNSKLNGIDRDVSPGTVHLKLMKVRVPGWCERGYDPSDLWDLQTPAKNLQEMNVTVMAARGLRVANLVGLSDPYCVVSWGSHHLGTTPVIFNTLDPNWNFESTFSFRLPHNSAASFTDDDDLKIELEQENLSLLMTLDVFDK